MGNNELQQSSDNTPNNPKQVRQSYPRGLITFAVIFALLVAILQNIILRRNMTNFVYRFQDLLVPVPPLDAQPRGEFTYVDIYLYYFAMLIQSGLVYGIMIMLIITIIRFIKSKFSKIDIEKQLLNAEGSNQEFHLRNVLSFRKNGIPYWQLLILIILLGYFLSSLIAISLFYGVYEVTLERTLIFPILTLIPIVLISGTIYYLKDRVSLTQISSLNSGLIFISLVLAFIVSIGTDIEFIVVLSIILVYTGLLLSIMKLRRPHKVFLEKEEEVNRFLQLELPNLEESGFSKWNFISLVIAVLYQMMALLLLYFETTPSPFDENFNQSRMVTFAFIYLGVIIVEIILIYTFITKLDKKQIEQLFRYISILLGPILFIFFLIDDFYFSLTSLLQQNDIPMGGTLIMLVIPSGILSGFAVAFLSKSTYFNQKESTSPSTYPQYSDVES